MTEIEQLKAILAEASQRIAAIEAAEAAQAEETWPKDGDTYWAIEDDGAEAFISTWASDDTDCARMAIGNVFRTRSDAEREAERRKVLTELRRLARESWTRLNEMNLFSFELASRLWNATNNEEAKRQIEPSRDTFEQAAEALYRIGLRWRDKQKFGATGDELTWLRESANWLEELLQISPEGMALEALMKAEQDVRDYWRRGEKAA